MKRNAALRIIREFENAVRDDEVKGCQHPHDVPAIEQRYMVLRERLLVKLMEVTAQ